MTLDLFASFEQAADSLYAALGSGFGVAATQNL
jgi:hypothetical protein